MPHEGAVAFSGAPGRISESLRDSACRRASPSSVRTQRYALPRFEPSGRRKEKRPREEAFCLLARPEGFEPPTAWFVARYSIQLSYGRIVQCYVSNFCCIHASSATRCRYSSPRSARRARPLGDSLVAFVPGRACSASPLSRRPSLTQLSYGHFVSVCVIGLTALTLAALRAPC